MLTGKQRNIAAQFDTDLALAGAVSKMDLDRPTGGPIWAIVDALNAAEDYEDLAPRIAAIGGDWDTYWKQVSSVMRHRDLTRDEYNELIANLEAEAKTRDLLCADRVNELADSYLATTEPRDLPGWEGGFAENH